MIIIRYAYLGKKLTERTHNQMQCLRFLRLSLPFRSGSRCRLSLLWRFDERILRDGLLGINHFIIGFLNCLVFVNLTSICEYLAAQVQSVDSRQTPLRGQEGGLAARSS